MNKLKRHEIFKRLESQNPSPTTELNYASSFELLIAVILSAQATDISVNKATEKLFEQANSPEKIIRMGITKIKENIKTIGLFNTKADNLLKTCHILLKNHKGEVPRTREELESLPGVGRKTANVILNTAFGQPTIAVDTHIFRVSNRTGLAKGKDVRKVEDALMKFVPEEFKQNAHHWLILHGRYTCLARRPRCGPCAIKDLCEFKEKTDDEG